MRRKTIKFDYKKNIIITYLLSLLAIIISLVYIFPSFLSPDFHNYLELIDVPNYYKSDFFYYYLAKVIKRYYSIVDSYKIINIIYVFLMSVLFFIFCYKINNIYKRTISFLFFSSLIYTLYVFPHFGLIQIRSGLAISIFYLSILFLLKNQITKYILLNFSSIFLFHKSAIIFILFLPIIYKKINFRFYNIIIPIIGLYLYFLNKFLLGFFILLATKLPNFFAVKLNFYLNNLNTNSSLNEINTFNIGILIIYIVSLILNSVLTKNKINDIMLRVYSLSIFSWFAFSIIPAIAQRFFFYFYISEIILLPAILVSSKLSKPLKIILFIFLFLYVIKQSIGRYILNSEFII